jgi:hypothetical protein
VTARVAKLVGELSSNAIDPDDHGRGVSNCPHLGIDGGMGVTELVGRQPCRVEPVRIGGAMSLPRVEHLSATVGVVEWPHHRE